MANSPSGSPAKKMRSGTSPRKLPGATQNKSTSSARSSMRKFSFFLMSLCQIMILGCLILWGWDFYKRTHPPVPFYYHFPPFGDAPDTPWPDVPLPVDPKNVKKMRALNHPNLTTSVLLQWATNAATASLTFNFYNYREVLKESRHYFTPTGYENFLVALESARTTADVSKKQLAVYAVVTDNPIVLKEGDITGGGYAWQVQFPMLLTYESEKVKKRHVVITLLIARVSPLESVQGVGIASFVMQEKKVGS